MSTLRAIQALLQSVPTIVWSGALGAVIALIGVLVSNREGRRRLQIQLSHERNLRTDERNSQWRRELYADLLSAVKIVVDRMGMSSVRSRRERDKNPVGDAFDDLSFLINKCTTICSVETAEVIGRIEHKLKYFDTDTRDLLRKTQLLRDEIDVAGRSAKKLRRAQSSLLEGHWRLRARTPSPSLKQELQLWLDRHESLEKRRREIADEFKRLQAPYFSGALDLVAKHDRLCEDVWELYGELVIQIRKELGFDDAERYANWFRLRNSSNAVSLQRKTEFSERIIFAHVNKMDEQSIGLSEKAKDVREAEDLVSAKMGS